MDRRISTLRLKLYPTLLGCIVAFAACSSSERETHEGSAGAAVDGRDRMLPATLESGIGGGMRFESRRKYEEANNLYAFSLELEGAAQLGDGNASWLIAKSVEYCMNYVLSPDRYSELPFGMRKGTPPADYYLETRERVSGRCSGFINADMEVTRSRWIARLSEGAESGSLAAEAMLFSLGLPVENSPSYGSELVRRVVQSGDPDAYLAISEGMGVRRSGEADVYDGLAGTQNATFAWQLAACDLGLDCSSSGALMTQYCANGGICSPYANLEQLVFNGLVSQGDAAIVRRLVASIKKGSL